MSLLISFYHRGTPCFGNSLLNGPLGGTESAMIGMAEALVARGHRVQLFCDVTQEGEYKGVVYRDWRKFEDFALHHEIDVFICIRHLIPIMVGRWAKLQIYFSPDAYDQPFLYSSLDINLCPEGQGITRLKLFSLAEVHDHVDAIFCVGEWQKRKFSEAFKIPLEKIYVVHNGVDLSVFNIPNDHLLANRSRNLLYCSTPYRGLEYLAEYFPEIKKRVPDATCTVLSGMQIYGATDADDKKDFRALYEKCSDAGLSLMGPVSKPAMREHFLKARVLAYPNTYAETFCMAVLEAQAMGLPIVTSNLAALKERVSPHMDGYLVDGHPSEEFYKPTFIDRTVALLTDDKLWQRMSLAARKKAETFEYGRLAALWELKFDSILTRSPILPLNLESRLYQVSVNGVNKTIDLKKEVIRSYLIKKMEVFGFPYSASQLLKMSVPSSEHFEIAQGI